MMPHRKNQDSIEEMGQLLDHIMSFEQDLRKSNGMTDPTILQEYKLLKEHLEHSLREIENTSISEFHRLTRT